MVPVRKFSTRTSARATRVLRISTPSGCLRSRVMSRLLRLMTRKAADSPSLWGGQVRDSSPVAVSSILRTSAPRSARSMAQNGPASTRERSSTRMPSSARVGPVMCATITFMTRLGEALTQRILVLDGAMGTMIQAAGLGPGDFGGPQFEGCNEQLNLTRPHVIRGIHAAYLDAGADCVSTNTFGCAPYVLAEYGLAGRLHAITLAAARIAREAAGERFVIGAMGPSTRSITVTRNVSFDEVLTGYEA